MDDRRKDLLDLLIAVAVTAVSLYPLYRDDFARWRMWIQVRLMRPDTEAEAMAQVRREISWMEHDGA